MIYDTYLFLPRISVLSDSRLWVLDRKVFQAIMMRTGMQRIEENISFLRSVPLLQNLSNNLLAKIADVLEVASESITINSNHFS